MGFSGIQVYFSIGYSHDPQPKKGRLMKIIIDIPLNDGSFGDWTVSPHFLARVQKRIDHEELLETTLDLEEIEAVIFALKEMS